MYALVYLDKPIPILYSYYQVFYVVTIIVYNKYAFRLLVSDLNQFNIYVNSNMIAASEFRPDVTIVSAGFDAARGDPLGCCDVRIFLLG